MNLLQVIQYSQNWNIGFCEMTPTDLIREKGMRSIEWMRHPYRDRWFADPFILKVTDSEIVVFVEECPIENPKGILCELVLDKVTKQLKQRHVLLELDTHLSYPIFVKKNGKVYVYPENGASGKLNIYEYDAQQHKLINPVCILEEAVADATIIELNGKFYMTATKSSNSQEEAYLYEADNLFGSFKAVGHKPYETSRACSRQGGNWLRVGGQLYRPAQDCVKRYGASLSIMSVDLSENGIRQEFFMRLSPKSYYYSLGLHTLNFENGLCVVDGYGYLHPTVGRLYYSPCVRKMLDWMHK